MFRILSVDSQVIYGSSMIVCPIVICWPWCIAFFSELLVAIHRSRCVSRVSMALCLELVVARFCPLVFLIVVDVSLFLAGLRSRKIAGCLWCRTMITARLTRTARPVRSSGSGSSTREPEFRVKVQADCPRCREMFKLGRFEEDASGGPVEIRDYHTWQDVALGLNLAVYCRPCNPRKPEVLSTQVVYVRF